MITAASSSAFSSRISEVLSASLNGNTVVSSLSTFGIPRPYGTVWKFPFIRRAVRASMSTLWRTASWTPWYAPSAFAIFSLPVYERAARIACIVASVPLFVRRTRFTLGKAPLICSRYSPYSGVVSPSIEPDSSCRITSRAMSRLLWPSRRDTKPIMKSRILFPSTS